jgi:hypothetical protein
VTTAASPCTSARAYPGSARSGEILVSSTVEELDARARDKILHRGVHALKGVPGEWHLLSVHS